MMARTVLSAEKSPSYPPFRPVTVGNFGLTFGRCSAARTVLLLTMDRTVPLLSAHRNLLHEYVDFTLAPHAVITELMDKTRLPGFLERSGTRHPRTAALRNVGDLPTLTARAGYCGFGSF